MEDIAIVPPFSVCSSYRPQRLKAPFVRTGHNAMKAVLGLNEFRPILLERVVRAKDEINVPIALSAFRDCVAPGLQGLWCTARCDFGSGGNLGDFTVLVRVRSSGVFPFFVAVGLEPLAYG